VGFSVTCFFDHQTIQASYHLQEKPMDENEEQQKKRLTKLFFRCYLYTIYDVIVSKCVTFIFKWGRVGS